MSMPILDGTDHKNALINQVRGVRANRPTAKRSVQGSSDRVSFKMSDKVSENREAFLTFRQFKSLCPA